MNASAPLRRSVLAALALLGIAACAGPSSRTVDRGIGGTGAIADRGIGGTGIVGTVTAFGSIWVNGLEIDIPATATLRAEGHPLAPDAVRLGHVVAVSAGWSGPSSAPNRLEARSVEVRYAVAGPVERIEQGGVVVLGQRIETEGALITEPPRPGAWVAVSGLRRPGGAIAAGRIDPWDPARGWLLRGSLESVDATSLTVSGFRSGKRTPSDLPAIGAAVRVSGTLAGGTATADSATADPFNPFAGSPFAGSIVTLSVETFVDSAGHPVGVPGAAEYATNLPAGSRVVIDGRIGNQGGFSVGKAMAAPGIGAASPPGMDAGQRAAGLSQAAAPGPGQPGGPPGVGRGPTGAGQGGAGFGAGPGRGGPGGPGGAGGRGGGGGRGR